MAAQYLLLTPNTMRPKNYRFYGKKRYLSVEGYCDLFSGAILRLS